MRYPVIVVKHLGVAGMTLYPFILVNSHTAKHDKVLLYHEKIHLRQQLEMLFIFFYLAYLINYLINLIKYKNHQKAYLNIIFEREAYKNERNFVYLEQRRFWEWRFYL